MNVSYQVTFVKSGAKIQSPLDSEHGFSLVELVVAGFAFGVAVIGIASMMSCARTWAVVQGYTRVSYYLAQDKLEQLLALDFAAVPNAGSTCPPSSTIC